MDFSQDLMRGTVVPMVLALLSERAMYGYEIVKVVNARTQGRLEWKEGTLYPALHRLEAQGYLRARWSKAAGGNATSPGETSGAGVSASGGEGGKDRKYYAITRKGKAELARRAEEWRQFSGAVDAVLMGV
ncbi:MAG: PadR family transcriptional regulator [Phycisphaeraceae bacterium]|nr:PadR family transcriptional regulator [Phycisphaeraceae bacterium]